MKTIRIAGVAGMGRRSQLAAPQLLELGGIDFAVFADADALDRGPHADALDRGPHADALDRGPPGALSSDGER